MWNFHQDFNHYPAILKRKNSNGPVVGYSFKDYVVRIDKMDGKWIVCHNFTSHVTYKTFHSYKQSWEFLISMIQKNRVKVLF
jgi:hypothetical protein